MPKLVQINSAINYGSTGKIAEQIGRIAVDKGWESYIYHSCRYARDTSLIDLALSNKRIEAFHFLGSFLFDGQGQLSLSSTTRLILSLEQIRPDIIHLHNIHGYYLNYRILFDYIRDSGIALVWTLHDCWPFTGHCTYFDRIGCEKWKDQCGHCPQRDTYPKSLIDRSFNNFILKKDLFTRVSNMTLVPVSDWLHELVQMSFLSKYPIRTIHNGIDLESFRPCETDFRKKNSLEGKFVVLGVADGYGQRKGLMDFNTLSDQLDKDVVVVMVGLSDDDRNIISPNILGMGRTSSQQELIGIYSAADVYINPTYEDNFPTTNIEALACGTPVITYNTGGSPEAIDKETGIVVKKGNIKDLIQAIETVRINGKSFYTQACRKRAERLFNKDDRFDDYLRVYEELL